MKISAAMRRRFGLIRHKRGRSKYMPHQGTEECRRRREQMQTGEYAPWLR